MGRLPRLPVAFYAVVGYLAILIVALMAAASGSAHEKKLERHVCWPRDGGRCSLRVIFTYLELFVSHAIWPLVVRQRVIITAIWIVSLLSLRSLRFVLSRSFFATTADRECSRGRRGPALSGDVP